MFSVGSKAKIWRVEPKTNYTSCQISTNSKNKKTNQYEVDFNSYANFVGEAHKANPKVGDIIKINECGVTTHYDKEKRIKYTNCTVFDYELLQENAPNSIENLASIETDDELPF